VYRRSQEGRERKKEREREGVLQRSLGGREILMMAMMTAVVTTVRQIMVNSFKGKRSIIMFTSRKGSW
jgi:hypothetical protein